jgi:DNA repair protein RadC
MPKARPALDGLAEASPHYLGHRERVRDRLEKIGAENFSDAELMEALLHVVIPRKDTKALAKDLLKRFGSFSGVLSAPRERLLEVPGLGETTVSHLKVILGSAQRFARDRIETDKPVLASWSALLDYCRSAMAFEDIEQFRVLFLDKKNRLIADEVQQRGTVDHTPVYPREVIKRTLELSATALILVHNHPSGDPTPSGADMRMTRELVDIAKPLGVAIHDHIIVGRDGHASFKGLGLI